MERRNFVKNLGLGAAATLFSGKSLARELLNNNIVMENLSLKEFPALPYAYDALEPYIDARTMEIHYDRHHRAYFNNYVAAIKGTAYETTPVEKVFCRSFKSRRRVKKQRRRLL